MIMKGFTAGIHLLIKKRGRFLILRRASTDRDDPGCWDLPGGGMHLGEQPDKAARREAKEETGLIVDIVGFLNATALPYHGWWSIETYAKARYVSGRLSLSHEHSAYRWVTRSELQKIRPKSYHLKKIHF
jgi:8-oxo-dGTP diphosphatase